MRLPFLQLESDIISHGAAEVSNLAGCSIPEALGHIALVRAWAVSHATDEAPPDGWIDGDAAGRRIEAAAHWKGEKGVLLQALIDAGHVRPEAGGHRILRLDPYVKAWEQNRKAKARMKNVRERSANSVVSAPHEARTTGEGSAKFDGQTQTQTQKEASASQAPAVASPPVADGEELPDATDEAEEVRPALVLEAQDAEPPKPEKRSRTPSAGEALYARLESQRQQACEMDAANGLEGVHFIPSRWAFSRQNKQLGPIAKTQTTDPEGEWARFSAAWGAFLDDTEVAARLDEPYALDYFLRCRGRYEGRAMKGAA